MIDENFRVYLIECNTNPSLETPCPLLQRIVPELLDNTFRIVLDPFFQSPQLTAEPHSKQVMRKLSFLQHLKYNLIFDDKVDGPELDNLFGPSR